MNSVKLVGNVGREITVKEFDKGKMVTFSLATDENYVSKQNNEDVKNTTWHNIVVWGQLAQHCERTLEKGKMVSIEGRLGYRQFVNKDNQTVKIAEITAFKVEEVPRKAEATV
jgi:single-strand DNA-binding protein